MVLITNVPKAAVVAPATPTDLNRWLSNEANQVIDEIQNLVDDTGQTKSASDLFQSSKAVARYVIGNTVVEDNGTSTHNGSVDIYIVQRDGGDSKKLPAVLLRGMSSVKIINANQSNNVSLQLGTTTAKEWKKRDMAGNITEIPVGEFGAGDIVFFAYDSDLDIYIVKKAFSNDEVQAIVGKFNVLNFLDFTASAPVAGGTIGDRYINTTGGTISAGTVDAAGSTVVVNKIYELYDISGAYKWREIDPLNGNIAFNENDSETYVYNGTFWNLGISPTQTKQIIISNNVADANNDIDFTAADFYFDDDTGRVKSLALIKRLDATFIAGTNQGGLDTGSKAIDTWYHCFAIYNPGINLSDYLFSTSVSSPTLPAGYTKKKRVGSILTDGSGNIIPFLQENNEFKITTPILSANSLTNVSTDVLMATPLGIRTKCICNIAGSSAGGGDLYISEYLSDNTNTHEYFVDASSAGIGLGSGRMELNTNLNSYIKHRWDVGVPATYLLYTNGWEDITL